MLNSCSYYGFIEISVFDANSVDPEQTPRSAASYLGKHCLHPFAGIQTKMGN